MSQLAILQIVVPLTAAPLTALFANPRLAWLFATIASWMTFAVSILLYLQLGETGELRYHVGGWPPPWGIEVRIDSLTILMLLLVSGASAVILPAAAKSLGDELKPGKLSLYFSAWLLLLTALIGIQMCIRDRVTLMDLLGAAKVINSKTFASFESYITVGMIYLVMTFSIVTLFKMLERVGLKHLQPR